MAENRSRRLIAPISSQWFVIVATIDEQLFGVLNGDHVGNAPVRYLVQYIAHFGAMCVGE